MSKKIFYVLIPFLILSFFAQAQKKVGDKAKGKASYYHHKFNGRKTASGEIYSASKMTCAHRTLPYGTMLKVTNTKSKKAVIVKVNDRGPFVRGRIVDLSYKAASKIDMINDGVADVVIEIVTASTEIKDEPIVKNTPKPKKEEKPVAKKEEEKPVAKKEEKEAEDDKTDIVEKAENTVADVKGVVKKIFGSKKNKKKSDRKTDSSDTKKSTGKSSGSSSTTPSKPTSTTNSKSTKFASGKTYSVWGTEMKPQGYGVQIASYADVEDAIKVGKEAHGLGLQPIYIQSGWANSKQVYRLIFGTYKTTEEAGKEINRAKSKGFNGAFVKKHL